MQPELRAKLDLYDILLRKWQQKINLISPATLPQIETRHFEDSLQLLPLIPETTKRLYDMGSGAGFPGLVIAMARPEISIHLIESDQRKASFLQTVSRETETPVTVHVARAENLVLPGPDVVTARALADLTALLKLTERWWTAYPQTRLVFPKGSTAENEVYQARAEGYEFDLVMVPSRTAPGAKILVLTGVKKG